MTTETHNGLGLGAPPCSAFFYVYGYDATHPVKLGHTKSLSSRLSNVKTLSEIDGKYLKTLQLPDKFFAKELERALLHLTWSWTAGKREMRRLPLPVFNWLVNLDILDAGIVLEDCHPKECSLDGLLSESQKQILPERKARFLRVKKANEAVGALFYKPNVSRQQSPPAGKRPSQSERNVTRVGIGCTTLLGILSCCPHVWGWPPSRRNLQAPRPGS